MKKKLSLLIIGFLFILALSPLVLDSARAFTPFLSCTARTETTVTLSWTKSTDLTFDYYFVASSISPNGPFNDVAIIGNQSLTTFAVSELTQNTTYYFLVRDEGSNGGNATTTASNICQVTTVSAPQLFLLSSTSSSITLTWNDNDSYSSAMPFYAFIIQENSGNSSQFSTVDTINNPSQNSCVIMGLSPDTSYTFLLLDEVGITGQNMTPSKTLLASTLPLSAVPEFPSTAVLVLLLIIMFTIVATLLRQKTFADPSKTIR